MVVHTDYGGRNRRFGNWKASGKAKGVLGRGCIMWGFGYSEPVGGSCAALDDIQVDRRMDGLFGGGLGD